MQEDLATNIQRSKENGKTSTRERAHHIATQLEICSSGLKILSDDYHKHIDSVVKYGKFSDGGCVSGYFSENIFRSTQSSLTEIATLRDYIARFISIDILGLKNNIDSMHRLLEEIDRKSISHPLADMVEYSYHGGAKWLSNFDAYRNLIAHNSPLKHAGGHLWVHQRAIAAPGCEKGIPTCSLTLPANPLDLLKRTRNQDFDEEVLQVMNGDSGGPDSLEYVHDTLFDLSRFAIEASQFSPVGPEPIRFNVSNIIPGSLVYR